MFCNIYTIIMSHSSNANTKLSRYSAIISGDPQAFRERMRKSFKDRFDMEERSAVNLEICIYNYAIEEANKERIVKKWENKNFAHLYVDRMRSVWMNLQGNVEGGGSAGAGAGAGTDAGTDGDSELLQRWKNGDITPEQMSTMTHQEMKPQRWKALIDARIKRDSQNTEMRASTDMFTCKKCKSKKCSYYELQTRSADEPSTIFITCLDCGKNWKQ